MPDRLSPSDLDAILALQLSVAWAGEAAGSPARLGWWKSDLVDPEGGGDLFARLVPKTAAWASLVLAREAARRVDDAARERLAQRDGVWTLFHFGFAVNEKLSDRLAYHRAHRHVPSEVLGPNYRVGSEWSRASFESWLESLGKVSTEVTPGGRRLKAGSGTSPAEMAPLLAAALCPLAPSWPLPYWGL
jgi:hypothetical protein